jgi:acetylornithine deacetylase/succinyl-diaminopimelate desuccinylase-like protein
VRELRRTIDDPRVEIEVGGDDETAAEVYASIRERQRVAASSSRTDLFAALAREVKRQYPGTVVTLALYEAATDAGPWRERGIPVYGIRPYPAPSEDLERMHGIDERVSVSGLNEGVDMVEADPARGGDVDLNGGLAPFKAHAPPRSAAAPLLPVRARLV